MAGFQMISHSGMLELIRKTKKTIAGKMHKPTYDKGEGISPITERRERQPGIAVEGEHAASKLISNNNGSEINLRLKRGVLGRKSLRPQTKKDALLDWGNTRQAQNKFRQGIWPPRSSLQMAGGLTQGLLKRKHRSGDEARGIGDRAYGGGEKGAGTKTQKGKGNLKE